MKFISAIQVILISTKASSVFGSSIRGASAGNEHERQLAASGSANEGSASSSASGSSPPSGLFSKANDYDCDDGCEVGGGGAPVCGVDGITYFNECFAICQDIEVERNGACPSDPPMNTDSYITGGDPTMNTDSYITGVKVTKEEMDAFKADKFVLVALRKPDSETLPDTEPVGPGNSNGSRNGNGNGGGGGRKGKRNGNRRSIRASRIVYKGPDTALEYAASYNPEDIADGVSHSTVVGDMPEPVDGDSNRLLTVLGNDTRFQQSGYDWPNWRLVQLDYTSFSVGGCSGAIIGANKVLTAAHCVYDFNNKRYFLPERVAPGRSFAIHLGWGPETGNDPWGQWNVLSATIYTEYINNGSFSHDIAVLTIANSGNKVNAPIGSYMGTFGMTTQPCGWFAESDYRIAGYPGDKPKGTLWNTGICEDWSYSWCGSKLINHKCDTFGGMSGSAIRNGSNQIVGVHTRGAGAGAWNGGTAMTAEHLANVQYW